MDSSPLPRYIDINTFGSDIDVNNYKDWLTYFNPKDWQEEACVIIHCLVLAHGLLPGACEPWKQSSSVSRLSYSPVDSDLGQLNAIFLKNSTFIIVHISLNGERKFSANLKKYSAEELRLEIHKQVVNPLNRLLSGRVLFFNVSALPYELRITLLKKLDARSLASLMCTCRSLYWTGISNQLWKPLYEEKFSSKHQDPDQNDNSGYYKLYCEAALKEMKDFRNTRLPFFNRIPPLNPFRPPVGAFRPFPLVNPLHDNEFGNPSPLARPQNLLPKIDFFNIMR